MDLKGHPGNCYYVECGNCGQYYENSYRGIPFSEWQKSEFNERKKIEFKKKQREAAIDKIVDLINSGALDRLLKTTPDGEDKNRG